MASVMIKYTLRGLTTSMMKQGAFFGIFFGIFLCINDCMLFKNPKTKMLQSGLLGGCCIRMKVNPPYLLCCCHMGSSFVIWTLMLSCWMKMIEGPSLGHFLSMAGMRFFMSMFLYTSWVNDSIGFNLPPC